MTKIEGQPIPIELDRGIRYTLEKFTSPSDLSESPCISSCLVRKHLRQDGKRSVSSRQALQEVFGEVLERLREHKPQYADLLKGRYWEGLMPKEMVAKRRPEAWSQRTFFNHQKQAIREFIQLFWEEEQSCQKQTAVYQSAEGENDTLPVPVSSAAELNSSETSHNVSEDVPLDDEINAAPGNLLPSSDTPESTLTGQERVGSTLAGRRLTLIAGLSLLALFAIIIAFVLRGGSTPTASTSTASGSSIPEPLVDPQTPSEPTNGSLPIEGTGTTFPTEVGTVIAQASEVPSAPTTIAIAPTPGPSVCGEQKRVPAPKAAEFIRPQGVTAFRAEDSDGAILNNKIRSLAVDVRGVWLGYYGTEPNPANGLGQYDRQGWVDCGLPGTGQEKNINAVAVDSKGWVWAATEKGGVLTFDSTQWRHYTLTAGLPTTETFGITIDKNDQVWVATWEGIAKFDRERQMWTVPYQVETDTLFNNHTHAIAFDSSGNIWVAHLGQGVSQYEKDSGKWVHRTADRGELGADVVFDIAVRNEDGTAEESVWFATESGVSKYLNGTWTTYRTADGLPSDHVEGVEIDPLNRVWVATQGGVAYLDGSTWATYNTIPTHGIAFGPSCGNCPFDTDHVLTGTDTMGLTHSRLPLPLNVQAIDVVSVRYRKQDTPDEPFRDEIVVAPGERFLVEIVVSPRSPYTLTLNERRGDFLSNIEESEENRYGAYVQMPVKGTVESGQRFTFTDTDRPFKAPDLPEGVEEQQFTTRYRVWMYTRYAGPVINVTFTVRRPAATPTPN